MKISKTILEQKGNSPENLLLEQLETAKLDLIAAQSIFDEVVISGEIDRAIDELTKAEENYKKLLRELWSKGRAKP